MKTHGDSGVSEVTKLSSRRIQTIFRIVITLIVIGILAGLYWWFLIDRPRRNAISSLDGLVSLVNGRNQSIPADRVVFPEMIRDKSPKEASQWLRDVLRDEVSSEGLDALRKHGRFGKLTELFPDNATAWAKAAGEPPDRCLAFRMEREGVTAEVVLVPGPDGFRISRCNNVKQMAQLPGS